MGAYWFNVHTLKGNQALTRQISVYQQRFSKRTLWINDFKQMDVTGFIATPGHVMLDLDKPLSRSPSPILDCQQYIQKGCTLLLIQFPIKTSFHFKSMYQQFIEQFRYLPIDYMIVPTISPLAITQEMVRYFSRQSCPFILIDVEDEQGLDEPAWDWVVQAQALKRIPLALLVRNRRIRKMIHDKLWVKISDRYGIIRLTDPLTEAPLSRSNLKDSGIFPYKGGFMNRSFADYNLYYDEEGLMVDDHAEFRYHDAVPNITVMRGRVVQVDQKIQDLEPGIHYKGSIYQHFV
ncbi:hypothetical protein MUO14_00765 [Halobacillus shinanisalinarum]|uniref:Uncharacterized protein n=1 Tax=Halobacillus shinanisalinarum TaxID=2932258 RepID=A0ABY4GZQ3_9BACI|nr:hypothetical protein [Halobacillus shinanisalinarum]UOQ93574.1 hypothetical protein MUO14_00765 [Halobacillus shinanisalinarum]